MNIRPDSGSSDIPGPSASSPPAGIAGGLIFLSLDCRAIRALAFIALLGAGAASAQTEIFERRTSEIGARVWLSTASTVRSHNAQRIDPALGNPTSVLTYEDLNAYAVELHARTDLGGRWFVRGNAGLGQIRKGSLDDEDFGAGQVKFIDATSTVKGDRLSYAGIDLGNKFWRRGDSTTAMFAGYHYWNERLDAFGVSFTTGSGPTLDEGVRVISEDVTWHSLRLGIAGDLRLHPSTRLLVDLAWVPYSNVRNEDSHHLRTSPDDLGPTPNIIMEGHGRGVQFDAELRHLLRDHWELGIGFRYWWLRSTKGDRFAAGTTVPLTELESRRTGLTVSITRRW